MCLDGRRIGLILNYGQSFQTHTHTIHLDVQIKNHPTMKPTLELNSGFFLLLSLIPVPLL